MRTLDKIVLSIAGLLVLSWEGAEASRRRYLLDVPEGSDSAFEVEVEVEHAGILAVVAEWDGSRIVSFRLDGPGDRTVMDRRSGPSPQRMEVPITGAMLASGEKFKLSIRSLPGRGFASGTLTLELPDAPEIVEERRKAAEPPPPPPPVQDPWTVSAKAPEGASSSVERLFAAVERFRTLVVTGDGQPMPDTCGWRSNLLRRLAGWRDDGAAGRPWPPASTLRFLQRLSATVAEVDELRTSRDPILGGPVPEDSLRKRAWLQVRKERIRPLERKLDALTEALRGGFAPDLEAERWPPRLVACLTASERHFEERVRLGGEEQASNLDLAKAQWPSILAAAEAFSSLSAAGAPSAGRS